MSCCSKEKMERNDYNNASKSHSAKSDREMFRICPSKLSKRELEDLYFTLLENNLELKKTINGQQDKIRVLSTQVQRMSNTQDKMMSKEMKENSTTKAFVNEQKDFITELKDTNQRMAERIQQLNMKLCSAKRFSKTTPAQTSNSRSFRGSISSPPKKHNCITKEQENEQVHKLSTSSQWEDRTPRQSTQTQVPVPIEQHNCITKEQENEQVHKLSTSSQWEDRTPKQSTQTQVPVPLEEHNCITKEQENDQVHKLSTSSQWEDRTRRQSTQTQVPVPLEESPPKSDQPCDENKCRSLMEELKMKIVTLQEELFNVHDEYSTRIGRLETEVSEVRKENIRVCSERTASEHELQNTVKRASDILAQHRLSEAKCSELTTELSIEKRKVAELDTRLKAANMSDKVNKTIEDHLTTIQETNGAPDDSLKCKCGCPPPHLPPSVMNENAPIQTLPLLSPPKKRNSEDLSTKTKNIPLKDSSSTSQEIGKTSPTKTISEDCKCKECECPPPQDLSTHAKSIQCELCDCASPKNTSTPLKDKVRECCCPGWVKAGILKSTSVQTQEENTKCIKCCLKDKHGATETPPSKNDQLLSPRGAMSRSPSKDKDSTQSSKTGDDSGYQDTDELILVKQNRELMTKILELQNQVDHMKIRMCEISETKPVKIGESPGSPKNTRDYAAVATAAPLLGALKKVSELPKAAPDRLASADNIRMTSTNSCLRREFAQEKIPAEQFEYNKSIEGGNESVKQVPFTSNASEERVPEPGKILRIEILGNPKEDARLRGWDDTRAKTTEAFDGTLQITEGPSSEKFSPLELMNDDYREHNKSDGPKLKIVEKKKLEIPVSSKPESGNASLKSPTSEVSGQPFNPEKLKYLEAEGIIAKPEFQEDMSQLKEASSSLTESVPSNPELGFGIPRLASKGSQDYKAKSDKKSQAAGSPSQQARDDLMDVLHGTLNLPMTEALAANNTKQTDETKKKEDCENCAACSFDKECEIKHENETNNKMNKLAPEMLKEQPKKHDQHNTVQMPGSIPSSDSKREKMRNLFSHYKKDRSIKTNKEDLYGQTTSASDGPANLPDVSILNKKQLGTDSNKIDKKIWTYDTKDKSDMKIYEQKTYTTTGGPVSLPDVPIIDKTENSKDAHEKKPVRIVSSINLDPPLLEVKMPTYCPQSERMLPTLLAPTNWRRKVMHVEHKAELAEHTDQKLADKSSQAPTNIAEPAGEQRGAALYRRRSGSVRERAARAGVAAPPAPPGGVAAPPACSCAAQHDGYCSDKPRQKGIQAHNKEEVKSSREQRRAHLTSERGTYTVNSKQTDTSPDNTDLEMSYLSDLPLEKEKKTKFKSRPLSPGEDRTTTFTNTYSYYSPPNNSLVSEGEIPPTTSKKSLEPYIDRPYLNAELAHKLETPPAQQMEAALQAISEELQRCRAMMLPRRAGERYESASQTPAREITPPIALRPGVATQGIGDTYAPMSIFTLHIGTVVLSDKAVLSSHDKNLVLKWKFYDQAVTMARMHTGRVVVFDFSTEYDIKVTEEFLHYLKHEEMPIIICELDQDEEPFASCVLPLRDALLHTNTRVDMSLALDPPKTTEFTGEILRDGPGCAGCFITVAELISAHGNPMGNVAGPHMQKKRANNVEADTFDTGDEVGVIDLWCLMRADANMLPGINLAIAQPGAAPMSVKQRHAGVMPQVLDDYNELDLSMGKAELGAPLKRTGRNQTYGDVEYNRTSNTWEKSGSGRAKDARTSETTQTSLYDPSKYPPIRDRKSPSPVASNRALFGPPKRNDTAQERQRQPELIINEVNPKIKSPGDIKHAVEISNRLTDSRARSNRSEDTFSQAQSSYGSLRSVLSRLQKRGSRLTQTHGGDQRSFINKLRKASRTGDAPPRNPEKNEATAMEKYMTYENISKTGKDKAEQSKKVTILPKFLNTETDDSTGEASQEPTEDENQKRSFPKLEITVLWLALNEECEAMIDPYVQRLYVAYTFLGRSGADLETPVSLPKPKHYVDKCYFNFRKIFELSNSDLLNLGHMARCRAGSPVVENENDCIIFSVVSEPADDPLGLESCVDIGYAYLYLGDLLEYSSGSPGYTEVIPVRAARGPDYVCGVLAVRLDGLDVVRRCLLLTPNDISGHSP